MFRRSPTLPHGPTPVHDKEIQTDISSNDITNLRAAIVRLHGNLKESRTKLNNVEMHLKELREDSNKADLLNI